MSGNNSDLEMTEEQPKAPEWTPRPLDGGWGWAVVLAAGLCSALLAGFQKSYSLIYEVLLIRFEDTAFNTALISAVFQGLTFFSGPFVSSLAVNFGHRMVAFVGGLLLSMGVLISAFMPSVIPMCFTYGVLSGLGTGMVMTTSMTMVPLYFEKRRGIAVALSTATSGLGGAFYGPLVMELLNVYSFTGTMLVCGALFLHTCAAAALLRPLKDNYPRNKQSKVNQIYLPVTRSDVSPPNKRLGEIGTSDHASSKMGSLANLQIDVTSSCNDLRIESMHGRVKHEKAIPKNNPSCSKHTRCLNVIRKFIKGMDIALFKDVTFSLFCLQMCSIVAYFYMQLLFLSGFIIEKGFGYRMIAVFLVILNVTDGVSRIFGGFVFDVAFVKRHLLVCHTTLMVFGYTFFICMIFINNMYAMFTGWALSIAAMAVFHSQQTNALYCIVSPEKLTSAFGLTRFASGIGAMSVPLIGGYIRDMTNTHWPSLLLVGVLGLCVHCLSLLHLYIKRCVSKSWTPEQDHTEAEKGRLNE